MNRRGLLVAAAALGGCSVLPERPYQEVRRFPLAPERPGAPRTPPPRAPALLLRGVRAAPGLDQRGLRRAGPDGTVVVAYWEEWAAPPAELTEAALRRWLAASGLFAAVVAPGSRLSVDLVLEVELTRLETDAGGAGQAGLSALLLSEPAGLAAAQIRGQFLPAGQGGGGAVGMAAALGAAFAGLEAGLRGSVPGSRVA